MTTARDTALALKTRFPLASFIPVPFKQKRPVLRGWQDLRLDEAGLRQHFNGAPSNIGLLTGEASGGWTDIDLDCNEAVRAAWHYLPHTACKFGRASRPASHWEYIADPLPTYKKFADPDASGDTATLLELRTDGHQTVFPGSVHPSGEPIEWETTGSGDPSHVDGNELLRQCGRVAACALLARRWNEGARQDIALFLAGWLLRADWPEDDVLYLIQAAALVAGDDEAAQRGAVVAHTAKKLAGGKKVAGYPSLAGLIGERAAAALSEWLSVRVEREQPTTPTGHEDGDFHLTDLGNARRMVALHGEDLRYCHLWGKWLVWDGRRWALDDTAMVVTFAKQTTTQMYTDAGAIPDDDARKALVRHALRSEAAARIEAMIQLAQSEPGIPVRPDELDTDLMLLNVQNGTVDLQTGELRPHRRSDLITKLVPVPYDPNATAPLWATFLDRIMEGKPDLTNFLQRASGYTLTGLAVERCIIILYGRGKNGKSTYVETMASLLGDDYARRSPTDMLMAKRDGDGIPNDVARLKGVRFTYASEGNEGRRLDEAKIKEITGGDTISARFMRGEWFDFRPQFHVFFSTNHKPTIRGTDPAIWDRIRLVPFVVRIPEEEQDKNLPAKLRGELPGILTWAVKGLQEWHRSGLGVPDEVRAFTDEYRSEQDVLGQFIADACVSQPQAFVGATPLYEAYRTWCKTTGEAEVKQTAFGRELAERGFISDRDVTSRRKLWRGIALLAAATTPEEGDSETVESLRNSCEPNSGISTKKNKPREVIPEFGYELLRLPATVSEEVPLPERKAPLHTEVTCSDPLCDSDDITYVAPFSGNAYCGQHAPRSFGFATASSTGGR